jgi:hypothetical protein
MGADEECLASMVGGKFGQAMTHALLAVIARFTVWQGKIEVGPGALEHGKPVIPLGMPPCGQLPFPEFRNDLHTEPGSLSKRLDRGFGPRIGTHKHRVNLQWLQRCGQVLGLPHSCRAEWPVRFRDILTRYALGMAEKKYLCFILHRHNV